MNVIAEALFPLRTYPETLATQEWMDACNAIQNTVNSWIKTGAIRNAATELFKLDEEQRVCLFDQTRADEAVGMLDDLQHRVGMFGEPQIKELIGQLRERLQTVTAYPGKADSIAAAPTWPMPS